MVFILRVKLTSYTFFKMVSCFANQPTRVVLYFICPKNNLRELFFTPNQNLKHFHHQRLAGLQRGVVTPSTIRQPVMIKECVQYQGGVRNFLLTFDPKFFYASFVPDAFFDHDELSDHACRDNPRWPMLRTYHLLLDGKGNFRSTLFL